MFKRYKIAASKAIEKNLQNQGLEGLNGNFYGQFFYIASCFKTIKINIEIPH